jgi:hypothetical protein
MVYLPEDRGKVIGDGTAVLNATESQSQIGAWVLGA